MIVGIDIGGTHFRVGMVDEQGVHRFEKVPTSAILKSEDTVRELADFLKGYIGEEQVETICIGFPATLDKKRERVLQLPNIKGLENIEVVSLLSRTMDIPVVIERDANINLYYDMNKHHIVNKECVVGLYFGTGIGCAIMINGKPFTGKNGCAGELGHIVVDDTDEVCGCGNRGCMETVAGGKYLAHLAKDVFKDDIAEMFARHSDDGLILQFIDRMAQAVCAITNLFDPDCIVIGGGVVNMQNFPKDELMQRIALHCRKPEPLASLRLIFVEDDEEKGVVGAAICAKTMQTK